MKVISLSLYKYNKKDEKQFIVKDQKDLEIHDGFSFMEYENNMNNKKDLTKENCLVIEVDFINKRKAA